MKFTEAINDALFLAMRKDPKVLCYGLGVTDPRRIFETTNGLVEEFGDDRVFDMPTAENAMTGVAVGAALSGYKSVMVHQRLDFFLLAMDQLVNSAAKWHYTFGGQDSVPITIRLIIGRGWGQGPTHCQSLQSWFAHVPGLKVVMPSTPADAKGLLLSSIFDPNPVVFLEHRWVHNQVGEVDTDFYTTPIGKANVVRSGKDVTIVCYSWAVAEGLRAANAMSEQGIDAEVIDLRTVSPIDMNTITDSLRKTGRILALDTGANSFSVASEIVSRVSTEHFHLLKTAPMKLASPDCPVPTSFGLTEDFYFGAEEIVESCMTLMNKKINYQLQTNSIPHDVPGDWFKGPF